LLALATFTLLTLVLTWPLVMHWGSSVPGNGADDPPLTWNLWWARYALLGLNANPFHGSTLFYPIGINLAFYTLTLLNGLLSLPLQATAGLIPATNLLLLSSFVLSGYGAFLLAAFLLGAGSTKPEAGNGPPAYRFSPVVAFSGGLLYAFASSKLFYAALGQWNIASSQWIPFYVLFLFKMGENPRKMRYPVLAAVFLLFQAYAELTYASFLVLFTGLWVLWRLWLAVVSPRLAEARREFWRLATGLLIVALVCAIGLIPVLVNMIPDMRAEGDVLAEGGGFADVFSADLAGFLVPTMLHPLLGTLVDRLPFEHTVGQHLYLGYSVLLLGLFGTVYWWRRTRSGAPPAAAGATPSPQDSAARAPRGGGGPPSLARLAGFWCLSALAWWLLTLGPTLRINGHDTRLPLPFQVVEQLPFFKGNRYPSRYSVLLFLSLAMLVALGVAALVDWSRRKSREPQSRPVRVSLRLAAPLLVLLMLFEHLSVPIPLSNMQVPPVYREIATSMPGDWTLLDIPVAWRNGSRVTGTLDTVIMFEQYYQTVHQKRLLAGNTSRNPPQKFQYFTEAPVINTLIALETGHQVDSEVVEGDRILAPQVLRFFDIQAIVVHPAQAGPNVVPYLEKTMPVTRFYEGEGTVGYRVELPPWPEGWTIEPGQDLGRLSYAEGWGVPEQGWIWAQRRTARLLVPMNGEPQRLTLSAYSPQTGQTLSFEVNGQTAATFDMGSGTREYTARIPASLVHAGLNEVRLHFEETFAASHIQFLPRTIGQTGSDSPVNLVVQSAGLEVGDFGLIYVNGRQVSPNTRGYNVVVLDPQTGAVRDAAAFDTHLDAAASQALAEYIGRVPVGQIVAVAAADEASRLLGQEAVDALRSIGATGDLRGKFRWGHAIIGVRGAPMGSALEATAWLRPVTLSVGEGATEPHLAAAFGRITFAADDGP
jgi:hypothetical protein